MAGLRVALRSPDRLLREAVVSSLSALPGVIVTGATDRFSDLIALCGLRRTDVVLVDIGVRFGEDETAGVLALRSVSSEPAVVLTYERLSPEATFAATHAGATRLVPHSRGLQALVEAVLEGPRLVDRRPGPVLTDRDRQVLSLISAGYSVREIASLIGVSAATVQNHKRRIFAKLDVHSQAHVVARAARMGLLWTPPSTVPAPGRPGRAPVVVVIGTCCDVRHSVMLTLIRHAVPVLVLGPDIPSEEDELMRLRDGAIAVLINGAAADWRVARIIGARTVVVITPYEEATIAGELPRDADAEVDVSDQLTHVIALAAQGYATSEPTPSMLRATATRSHSVRSDVTPRELDILRSIALGHSVRQTAAALGITSKTVENTQARLFRKLSVRNRAEALAVAYSLGLVMED